MGTGVRRSVVVGRLAVALAVLLPGHAGGMVRAGPVELSGNAQSQNLIRHPDADDLGYIQNRNTLRLRLDYDWLQAGKFYGRFDIPFLQSSKLFLLYRGVYDSIYDTTPGFIEKNDLHGRAYGGKTLFEFAQAKGEAARQSALLDAERAEARGDTETAAKLRREAARDAHFARDTLTLDGLSKDERDAI